MKKLLKWTAGIFGTLLVLMIIAMVVLVTVVSPNRFKPVIIDQVKKQTGRTLIMDGDLSWTFFPTLGVKVGHVLMNNPEGFREKTFAEIDSMTVSVKLLPLFSGSVQSSGIALHGMKLNLIKSADGKTNWSFSTAATTENTATTTTTKTHHDNTMNLAVSAIDISDAAVNYTDQASKKSANIDHFELHAKNINLTDSFPVETQFDFTAKNPDASGHIQLTTDASLNLQKSNYSLRNVNLIANIHQANKNLDLKLRGNILANLNQETVQWSDLKASVANVNMSGKMNVSHLNTTPEATGQIAIAPFDLKTFLKNIGEDNASLETAKDVDGELNFTAAGKSIDATGKFNVDTVVASKIKLSNIHADMRYKDNVLTLAPIKADLYQGNLAAQTQVKLTGTIPQIMLQAQLRNVQAEPLLTDLRGGNQKFTLSGAGNIDLQVTTQGVDANAITKNLNGTSHVTFNNGTLKGMDLGYLVDSAAALAGGHATNATNTSQTNFGNLTATAVIRDGVVTNNDLLMDSPRFTTTGKGTIDLVNQKINYTLQSVVKQQTNAVKSFSGITIPIAIQGSLSSPSIRLDTGTLLKSIAAQQMQQQKGKIEEKIQDQIQKKIGGELPPAASDALKSLLGN